ncbi:unnamed protein product [marine sediment metagenome]|uniref:Uncharacterized protein n=1 Tax=marine sediment metagenome TaxID=412755 RepID=X1STI1_9ZZZZ
MEDELGMSCPGNMFPGFNPGGGVEATCLRALRRVVAPGNEDLAAFFDGFVNTASQGVKAAIIVPQHYLNTTAVWNYPGAHRQ